MRWGVGEGDAWNGTISNLDAVDELIRYKAVIMCPMQFSCSDRD